ncbi:MAG TPA: hypothetical protein VHB47_04200 [Thermoanaerobaculia bacterium]|jgi:hypothetical protein|nr:hypothetical protein [Thermoanaerobaculia bacterium]
MPSAPHKRPRQRRVLDDLLGVSEAAAVEPTPDPAAAADRAAPEAAPPAAAWRLTFHLPAAVLERAKNAVYHTPGLTLAGLGVAALTRELDRLEEQRGQPFPARNGPLRTGRPIR